jgi:nicotinate phosphoribosyltransferase
VWSRQAAVLKKFPKARAKYVFKCRKDVRINTEFLTMLQSKINNLDGLSATQEERNYLLSQISVNEYYDYLSNYKLDSSHVLNNIQELIVKSQNKDVYLSELELSPTGRWVDEIWWEVPLLYLVSECYFKTCDTLWSMNGQKEKFIQKGMDLTSNDCKFVEFGTRRRRNFEVQEMAVSILKNFAKFAGTSNVYLAKKYNVPCLGTQAHEWTMGISGLVSLKKANKFAIEYWKSVYPSLPNICLPDTFTTDVFINDLVSDDLFSLCDGFRQDSGVPMEFFNKFYSLYQSKSKHLNIMFSDSLNVEKCVKMQQQLSGLNCSASYGMGTFLTNDFDSSPALNIVMKLAAVAESENHPWVDLVKLGDGQGKEIGNKDAVSVAKYTFFGKPIYN